METMETHLARLETKLVQWGARLDELMDNVEEAGADAAIARRKRIDELKAKHKLAKAKLDELKAAGSDKWETFKSGVESAWHELDVDFKKLTN